jgi:hypothetical protein
MSYRNKLRAAIPGVFIRGRRQTDPNVKPGPTPQLDGMMVRSRRERYFEADYFYEEPNQENGGEV